MNDITNVNIGIFLPIYRLFCICSRNDSQQRIVSFCNEDSNAGIFTRLSSLLRQICQPWYFSLWSVNWLFVTSLSYIRYAQTCTGRRLPPARQHGSIIQKGSYLNIATYWFSYHFSCIEKVTLGWISLDHDSQHASWNLEAFSKFSVFRTFKYVRF